MKRTLFSTLVLGLLTSADILAQTPPTSGRITYEGMRRIDRSQMRMVINGQEIRPGSPGAPEAPEGMPDVISFTQKLVFAGTMAKEERDRPQNMMVTRRLGGGPGEGGQRGDRPREMRMTPPFDQTTYLDLANRQRIDVMTIKKDSVSTTYRTERPLPKAEKWEETGKTKKISGYTCRKATATARIGRQMMGPGGPPTATPPAGEPETYTVWYTTELPFTYSPVAALTPERGVVLQIESDNESYKATGVSAEAVAADAVQPPADAKAVSADEMNELRRKAMADFRQKMMTTMPFPGRN